MLYKFADRYWQATHPIERTKMGASAVTDIVVTVILAIITAGVGAVANIAAKSTRLVKVAKLLKKIAAVLKKTSPDIKILDRGKGDIKKSKSSKKTPTTTNKGVPKVKQPKPTEKVDNKKKKEYGENDVEVGPKTTPNTKKPDKPPKKKVKVDPDDAKITPKEVQTKRGTKTVYKRNRKNMENDQKITGHPEAEVKADAKREIHSAQRVANRKDVEKVYMGEDADKYLNPGSRPGTQKSPDTIGVTKDGKYVLSEAKGGDTEGAIKQLKHANNKMKANGKEIVHQEIVVENKSRLAPGYSVSKGSWLQKDGKLVRVGDKPVEVVFRQ
jgi:outer membrane biosynthesis protein TonB